VFYDRWAARGFIEHADQPAASRLTVKAIEGPPADGGVRKSSCDAPWGVAWPGLPSHKVSTMHRDTSVDADALRAARVKAGLTQHELARLVGVAGGERVSRWERGSSAPRPDVLHRIARVLSIGPSDLLTPLSGIPDLRRLRVLAGLSSRDLAARTHTSLATIQRWEAGRIERLPDRATLAPVAAALRVAVDDVELALATGKRGLRSQKG